MKDSTYTNIVCRSFCSYYKAGREKIECGGYQFLKDHFTLAELQQLIDLMDRPEGIRNHIPPDNEDLFALVCDRCDFLIDGCDYRDNRSGPPCGGYILIYELISH